MPVEFRCPHCKKLLRVPDNSRGKRGRCPHCKEINDIPAESEPVPSSSPAAPSQAAGPKPTPTAPTPRPAPAPKPATPALTPLDPFTNLPPAPYAPGPLDLLSDLSDSSGLTPIPGPYPNPLASLPSAPAYGSGGFVVGNPGGGNFGGGYNAPAASPNPYLSPAYVPSYSPAGYSAHSYSSDQFDESKPLNDSGREGVPWEDRRREGTLFETAKQVLLQPAYAFGSMRRTGGLGRPLGYAIYCSLIGGLISLMIWLLIRLMLVLFVVAVGNKAPEDMGFAILGLGAYLVIGLISLAIFGTLGAIIGAFVHSAVLHLVLMMLSGARGTYEATFRLTCYVQGSLALLYVVPCLGPPASFIWYYIATIIGVRWTHEISVGKSVAAVLLTSLIFTLLVVVPIIILWFLAALIIAAIAAAGMR